MDLLFLHVPKFNNYYKPFGRFSFINLPPIGLLGLADFLRKNRYSTRIVHLGVEKHKYGEIDLDRIIMEHRPAMVGLGLHWHFQSFDVIETAKKIKQHHPDVAVVLGGFTASAFAEEILRQFDCIDFVIRGDAEVPLRDLMARYHSGESCDSVPNLAFREDGAIRMNPISYVGDQNILDSLCYTDFALMKDYRTFVDSFSRYVHLDMLSEKVQRLLMEQGKMFPVFLGRGCVYNCSFCGGAQSSQKNITTRQGVYLRPFESVLDSLRDLQRFGFDTTVLPLDPPPAPVREKFYLALFEAIKKEKISLTLEVERYHLPTREFLRKFHDLPGKNSWITLSPGSHKEEIRRKNGLNRYSNSELEECLKMMDEEGVNSLVYFWAGQPFETEKDLKEMGGYMRHLRNKFKRVRCRASMIEIEPASPMSSYPEHYGVMPQRRSFMDYYQYHGQAGRNPFLEMGYERVGCPSQTKTKTLFCRHLCTRFDRRWASPLVRKTLCNVAAGMWKSGMFGFLDRMGRAACHSRVPLAAPPTGETNRIPS